jgi:hypothetical protein
MTDYVKNDDSQRFGERRDERWQTGSPPIRRVGERAFDSSQRSWQARRQNKKPRLNGRGFDGRERIWRSDWVPRFGVRASGMSGFRRCGLRAAASVAAGSGAAGSVAAGSGAGCLRRCGLRGGCLRRCGLGSGCLRRCGLGSGWLRRRGLRDFGCCGGCFAHAHGKDLSLLAGPSRQMSVVIRDGCRKSSGKSRNIVVFQYFLGRL